MPLALEPRRVLDRPVPIRAGPPPISETDLDRILKMIPTEMIAFYTACAPIVTSGDWRTAKMALFVLGALCVPVILYLDSSSTGLRAPWPQYAVRTLSYLVWSASISPPLAWFAAPVSHGLALAVLLIPFLGARLT